MQRRAAQVTAPQLAPHAHRAGELASQSVAVMEQLNAEAGVQSPLAQEPPPSIKVFVKLNSEFVSELGVLEQACPAT
jgi:hypothetical protein